MRNLVLTSLAVIIAVLSFLSTSPEVVGKQSKFVTASKAIPGQYIVVLADNDGTLSESQSLVEERSQDLAGDYSAVVGSVFSRTFRGFTAKMSKKAAMELSSDKRVEFVEEDSEISPSIEAQTSADWGLDRIDQTALPLNTNFVYSNTGAGVNVYVLDSGINPTHQDFGGRAAVAYDVLGQNGIDCRGHGTHIAGTIASSTYGVAKSANVWGVRVLPCVGTGQLSDLMLGIEWVTANHISPAVVNISINAAGTSPGLNTSINNSIAAGVHYVVSAGNFNADACGFLPANIPGVIVVGATTASDNRAGYSNQGPCIDVWAPGHGITSLDYLTNNGIASMSGTSMASPMVAGTVALYLQNHPTASPATVQNIIKNSARQNIVTNVDATSTRSMLHTWLGSEQAPSPGKVKIVKRVRTRTGGTASQVPFNFAATNLGPSSFDLIDNDLPPSDIFENALVYTFETPGAITVTESQIQGWRTHTISCTETPGSGMPHVQNTTVDMTNRRANIVVEQGELVTCTFDSDEMIPTAANVSINGRVEMGPGRSVARAMLVLTEPISGRSWITHTNTFGYYQFPEVPAGVFYVVTVSPTKRYTFTPDSYSFVAEDDLNGVNFTATMRE
jgi:hypothetical protein